MTIDDKIKEQLSRCGFDDFFCSRLIRELELLYRTSLEEDLDKIGDLTSNAILNNANNSFAKIYAKQPGIFSGGFIIEKIFTEIDPSLSVKLFVADGDIVKKGKIIAQISGLTKSILIGERTVLNFLSRISGISTLTNEFVKKTANSAIKILDTRKTMPGWRYLDKYAVRLGGASNHRIGLFDMVLIKENHISAAGGIIKSVKLCNEYLTKNRLNVKIEIETKTLSEVTEALNSNVDRIMLDNMNHAQIKEAVRLINNKKEIEISGGITLENIESFMDLGVNYISIGALTHSAKGFDFSLILENC